MPFYSVHATEESARLTYIETVIGLLVDCGEDEDETELRALTDEQLHKRFDEVFLQQTHCWYERATVRQCDTAADVERLDVM
ncbi:hypothetical protein J2X36_004541 [Methylobacterium sp. BE186]|uniref:hypothetical protein n=1 Tax=Methylobacterium sp. BE186 TaxID=2817715 RepID=UPI002864F1B2|nr:hypothetical protein [Methylobacterium sp. BE186]MDR7039763.1 hypothetical protein [Methylobacterium sp. BE186]